VNEHEPRKAPDVRPAPERELPDRRRLDVARNRFVARIAEGIDQAATAHTGISTGTARCIAHVLGRAYGRESALADFGRTGEGEYPVLRDEYLGLYNDPEAPLEVRDWINWLGTYLVEHENLGRGRQFMNEYRPPRLEQLLVQTELVFNAGVQVVHLPASLSGEQIAALNGDLADLALDADEAMQAFLSLPDVNAATPDLVRSFHDSYVGTYDFPEDAGRELTELDSLELALHEATESRALPDGVVLIDYSVIDEHVRSAYDLVEWKGRTYVFNK
jgi:hypothetical protein